nr:G-type lectin S-receptor-like serine/threonine-protein kinase At1g11300 [Ipomoea batatas]
MKATGEDRKFIQYAMEFRRKAGFLTLCHCHHLFLTISFFCLQFGVSTSTDTITAHHSLEGSQTILSNSQLFKMGFFSPENSTKYYVGIMLNVPSTAVIWVANRDKPMNDSRGSMGISENGNLVVLDGEKRVVWSTSKYNISTSSSPANTTAQLQDSGNLVMKDGSSGSILWQSFGDISDTLVEGMKLGNGGASSIGITRELRSWKSPWDPSPGTFSFHLRNQNIPEVIVVQNNSKIYWRSGLWNKQIFIGVPNMNSVYDYGVQIIKDDEGDITYTYDTFKNMKESTKLHYVITSTGSYVEKYWDEEKSRWVVTWKSCGRGECDMYGKCGPFGVCDPLASKSCSCLQGYKPRNEMEWRNGNWSSGCIRNAALQCHRNSSNEKNNKKDGFLKLQRVKVPFARWVPSLDDSCETDCLRDCGCIAYSYYTGIGCMHWSQDLIDIQQFSSGGADLYIRLPYSELDQNKNNKVIIIVIITLTIGSLAIASCLYFGLLKHRGKESSKIMPREDTSHVKLLDELPVFDFEIIAKATEHFHSGNKLGEGGFGPVYKFMLIEGNRRRKFIQCAMEFRRKVGFLTLCHHLFLTISLSCLQIGVSRDTITAHHSLEGSETILSNSQNFKMGFFRPENSTKYYVGIMFNVPSMAVVWVANRDKGMDDSRGSMGISEDGNLEVLDGQNRVVWSTSKYNISTTANTTAQLLDTGNLVLKDSSSGRYLWESFGENSDTFLEKMKIGNGVMSLDMTSELRSWKSPWDPSPGSFSYRLQPQSISEMVVLQNNSKIYWRSGPWNKQIFIGLPHMDSFYNYGAQIINDNAGGYITYTDMRQFNKVHYVLNSTGRFLERYWDEEKNKWVGKWESCGSGECDVYGKCGPFGVCDPSDSKSCSCLQGYKPMNEMEWRNGNWSSGCIRKAALQCHRNSSNGENNKKDGFLKLQRVKVPDFARWVSSLDDSCETDCLRDCGCIAYSYYNGIGCMHWLQDLIDIQQFSTGGADLYIRLPYSELDTITANHSLEGSETILSNSQNFKMGFFRPENSTKYYVGIMFNVPSMAVVWVANRDKGMDDSRGSMGISEDGNLVVLDGEKRVVWKSNISTSSPANTSAQLLDTGNLVLKDSSSGSFLWESFGEISDTLVEGMKLGNGASSIGITRELRSWKSPWDPSPGTFSFRLRLFQNIPEVIIVVQNNSKIYWRSGLWNKQIFIGLPHMSSVYDYGSKIINYDEGDITYTYDTFKNMKESTKLHYVITSTGSYVEKYWDEEKSQWVVTWESVGSGQCDMYGKCGPFGICDPLSSKSCSCLRGYRPKDEMEWGNGNWSSGCIRNAALQCHRNSSNEENNKKDGFLKLQRVKVPDFPIWVPSLDDTCETDCLRDCGCIAYSYYTGIGCMHWSQDLIDIQQFLTGGADLYIRLPYSELGTN